MSHVRKTLLSALALLALCLGSATAALADPVTIRFTELTPRPVNGVSLFGVTFSFTLGGLPSPDAFFGGRGPGSTVFVQDPSLEGDAHGRLTLNFAAPTSLLSFGGTRNTFAPALAPGFLVQLFDPSLNSLGVFPLNLSRTPPFLFPEGLFSYSGAPVSRAVITFPNVTSSIDRFAIDNLTFDTPAQVIPEPATLVLLGTGLAGVGAAVRKRRKAH